MKSISREETKAYKTYQEVINWAETQEGKARRMIRRFKAHQDLLPSEIDGLDKDVEMDEAAYLKKANQEIQSTIQEFIDLGWITKEQAAEIA